jgi:hypothetical protein
VAVYCLKEGKYVLRTFEAGAPVQSGILPGLEIQAETIFQP